jgi:hypothetical protein
MPHDRSPRRPVPHAGIAANGARIIAESVRAIPGQGRYKAVRIRCAMT